MTESSTSLRGGVQSIERVFELLETMADAGGEIGLSEMASATGLPTPTIHRLLQTLTANGYVIQQPNRRYALGPRLIRLGDGAYSRVGGLAQPVLNALAEQTGETANLGMLNRDEAVYLAQSPSRHSMRMFTEVGRRVSLHCTGVGKILLARLDESRVREIVERAGLPRRTERTITKLPALLRELERIREAGYAIDDGEQELGVRCVAVAVEGPLMVALSVSGPEFRISMSTVETVVPPLLHAAEELGRLLSDPSVKLVSAAGSPSESIEP